MTTCRQCGRPCSASIVDVVGVCPLCPQYVSPSAGECHGCDRFSTQLEDGLCRVCRSRHGVAAVDVAPWVWWHHLDADSAQADEAEDRTIVNYQVRYRWSADA